MALTRLFIRGELRPDMILQLDQEQARYIGRALRLRPGHALTVFNGECGEFAATLASVGKSNAEVEVGATIETISESPLKVHLVQGISRGERMDIIVQKATELGVKRITPVLTEYGVVKFDTTRAARRRDHWEKIAVSACEQSGRIRPPLIDLPLALKSWFGAKTAAADVDLILQPGATVSMASLSTPKTKVCLLIGPEGGFSDIEYDDARVSGFTAVSLGPRVLRTETAAIAALAVAESLWGDLGLN
jgi:16S rRNA (uracil1498-N3)-methyltransferase